MKIEIVILIASVVMIAAEVDFCQYNCDDNKNIGCDNEKKLGSNCTEGASLHEFTEDEIAHFVDIDNKARDRLASGSLDGFKPAARMPRSKWNAVLATQALYNAQTCIFAHDKCRNTPDFKYAGQNIGIIGSSSKEYNMTQVIDGIHESWYSEYKNIQDGDIDSYPSNMTGRKDIGHFTQVIHDLSTEFGCAASIYKKDDWYNVQITCDYASTNILGNKVYLTGDACSKCKKGCDTDYTSLCPLDEGVDPNDLDYKDVE